MAQDEEEVLVGELPEVASVPVVVAPEEVAIDEWMVVDCTCTPVARVALNQAEIVA